MCGSSSGPQQGKWSKLEDENPWKSVGVYAACMDRASCGCEHKLDWRDDEEFDIPLLFNDIAYDAAKIPDMDVDEGDGGSMLGRFLVTKSIAKSCWIYAIKNQF